MSDCSLILGYLQDHEWHNGITMSKDLKPNCINWAYRSRISNLKEKGHIIDHRIGENGCAEYKLISSPAPQNKPQEVTGLDNSELRLRSEPLKKNQSQGLSVGESQVIPAQFELQLF